MSPIGDMANYVSKVVTSLTGMNVYAAIFLIPTGTYKMLDSRNHANWRRCLRLCYPRWTSSDLLMRLLAYMHSDDYHFIFHVPCLYTE